MPEGPNAVIDGVPFRLDPDSASWSFSAKVSDIKTIGGKVVQVYGTRLTDMVMTGSFGSGFVDPATGQSVGGWEEQLAFLDRMKKRGYAQSGQLGDGKAPPVRFIFPSKGWDFLLSLVTFSSVEGSRSITLTPGTIPRWRLQWMIEQDNGGLTQVAEDRFISRIAAGIGWVPDEFNGPLTADEVNEMFAEVGASNLTEYLEYVYTNPAVPIGPQGE